MKVEDVTRKVQEALSDARVVPSGEACNLHLIIISPDFQDLSILKRQQMVLASLYENLATGELHAITLKTYTPCEWDSQPKPLLD